MKWAPYYAFSVIKTLVKLEFWLFSYERTLCEWGQIYSFTDPPETSIYPKTAVELGVQNTLICHVTGFFPPPVNVSWTKNNVMVTDGVSLSQNRPRDDGSFHMFSSLKILPEERDIYSCTVNHRALQAPQTLIWGKSRSSYDHVIHSCFLYEWYMCKTTDSAILMKQQEHLWTRLL